MYILGSVCSSFLMKKEVQSNFYGEKINSQIRMMIHVSTQMTELSVCVRKCIGIVWVLGST